MNGSIIDSSVDDQFMLQWHEQCNHFYHNKCNGGLLILFTDNKKNTVDQEMCILVSSFNSYVVIRSEKSTDCNLYSPVPERFHCQLGIVLIWDCSRQR